MKVTIEVPEDLYRRVKAKSALEGRPVREVAEELFQTYVEEQVGSTSPGDEEAPQLIDGEPAPPWFGMLRRYARQGAADDMDAIRASIARGIVGDRKL